MKTAKELRDRYELDLEKLQNKCKHTEISDWMEHWWAPAHYSGYTVKICNICNKIVLWKYTCGVCHREFERITELTWKYGDVLCQDCRKKGRYYCYEHKQFHNNRYGYCGKCVIPK
jgi:DNA-directed RNA polymerase subunit RPC12/RpoP